MRFLAVGLGLSCLLAAPGARAYCRTTTSQVPAGYDPTVSGCWTQGTPLSWGDTRVPYGVASAASKQVTLADATRIADLAFGAWEHAKCDAGAPGISAYDDGPIATVLDGGGCASSTTCNPQARDVIVFDDAVWPHDDPANTLALTTVTYGVNDGRIFEAYTEVNSAQHKLTTQEPPPAGAAYDLQAILTHEAGHFFGLAHATDTGSIMYAYYKAGAITLTADDVHGFCAAYPTPGPSSGGGGGCALAPLAPGAGRGAMVLLGLGVAVAGALRARRARRRRG